MATITGDLSLIKDEDTLKKMWQDAEDFGQKKEIRAHMYKLREARLNELYSSEMTNEIHNFAKATKTSNISSKHADNLADHSFMSMKSKEIRDSESPTRELGFRIPDKDDHSWVIESRREQSKDGKTKTSSKIASTAGSQKLGSTKLDYAANTQHVKTVHEDGDQNNYVKSSGTSSKSETHQEASGGDEFHSFKKSSSSQSSSSSSRMVREQKSSQDFINVPAIEGTCVSVDKKVYTTSNVPQDLKNHPSYVEGHTKVTRETKTLSDGTIVTKVRYETDGIPKRSADQSYSSQYSSSRTTNGEQNQSQSSQNYSSSHTKSSEQHISGKDDASSKYYVEKTHNMPQTTEVTQNGRQNHIDAQTTAQKVASSTTIHTNVYEKASRDVVDEKRSQKADKVDFESATEHKVCVDTSKKVDSTKTVPKTVPKSTTPTEGQYDTTYNTDYTSKQRISVDISPTHNAFASSLRSTSPDRASTRTSTSSLRSISPEKMRHSSRYSPDRQGRSPSPKKQQFSSSETITYTSKNKAPERRSYAGSTFSSSTKKVEESTYDSSSLTRRNNRINQELSRSRSPSPTSTTSDFEYFKTSEVTTDLDDVNLERPTTLELNSTTTRKIKKYSERSPTSPIKDLPKEVPRKSSLKYTSRKSITPSDEPPKYFDVSPTDAKPGHPDNKILKRTDTYEERCKQILGLASDSTETRRSSIESIKRNSITDSRKSSLKRTSLTNEDTVKRRISKEDIGETTSSRKSSLKKTNVTTDDYVKRKASIGGVTEIQLSPDRSPERPVIQEFPSQIRRSPERKPTERYTEKISTSRYSTTVNEFSTDSAKSPERKVPEKSPEKVLSPTKKVTPVSEFQTRRSPERKTPGKYPTSPTKKGPEICEFPSQIRRSPERKSPEKYPERATSPTKKSPLINEFPSQIRRSPERKTPEKYPQKSVSPTKTGSGVCEFPSQIRRSPEQKAPEKYPQSPTKKGPQFPTQTTRSPERKLTEIERAVSPTKKAPSSYPQKPLSPTKTGPKITDFPRSKSPDKFTCELTIDEKITDKQRVDDFDHYNKKYISYENAVPVQEPIVLKKSVKPLGPGDVDAKFETEMLIQQEVQQIESSQTPHQVVKKQVVTEEKKSVTQKNKDQSATFIKTEKTLPKQDSRKNIQKPSEVKKFTTTKNVEVKKPAPVKKPLAEKNINTQKHVCHKFIGATEYNTEFTKKAAPVKKPVAKKVSSEKITLMDVENLNKQTVDTVHRRTHRVDSETKIVKVPSKKNVITTKTVDIKKSPSAKKVTETRKIATVTVTPKKTTSKAGPVRTPSKPKVTKVEHTYSSDEESLMNSTDTLTTKISLEQITKKSETKTSHTKSDQVGKPKTKAPPVRGVSKPELLTQTPRPKLEKKCLSTKSIMIHNELDLGEREILVRLEKTSRETSPLRISPVPSTSYSEDHIPRYPDRVIEPDEATSRRKPVNLSSLPIMEDGSTGNVSKIVEITENDKVDETDVSLLSVNKKISKFLRTSEDLSTKPIDVSVPAPKVDRPIFTVDKGMEKDECLLSVSDKVSKFITTAEQLTTAESLRPKSPRCQNYPSDFKKFPTAPVDETLEGDVCLLSITDKVTKFVSTAENLTKTDSSKTESKQVTSTTRRGSTPTECPQVATEDDMYKTPQSPTTEGKPKRRTSVQFETAKTKTEERIIENTTPKSSRRPSQEEKIILSSVGRLRSTESIKKAKALFENSTTTERELARSKDIINRPSVFSKKNVVPKRLEFGSEDEAEIKTSQDEIKLVVNKFEKRPSEKELTRKPSPERKPSSPTKAKGVSEFPSQIRRSPERKPQDKPQTRSPTRSSPSQLQEFPSQIRRTPSTDRATPVKRTPSPTKTTPSPQLQEYPSQVRRTSSPDRKSTPESTYSSPRPASPTRRPLSPDRENPHYMAPLDRSLRNKSPHKEAVEEHTTTKFGVTLRKTGSTHKVQPIFSAPKTVERKSSITFERSISEDEIESIFDLETLEHLVETVTSYEIRRRIRVQIRLVKKLIAENKLTETIRLHEMKRSSRRSSVDTERKTSFDTQTSSFTSKYSSETRKASRSPSPDKKTPDVRRTSIPQETTQPKVTTSSYTSSRYSSHTDKSSRSSSPEKTTYTVRRTSQEVPQDKVTTSSSFSSRYSSQTGKSSRSSSPDKTTYTVRKTSFPKEPPQPKGTTSSSFTSRYSSQTDKSSRSSSPDKTTYTIRKTSIPEEITRVVEPKTTSHSSSYSSKYSTETRQSTRSTSPDKTTYSTVRKSSIPEEKVVQPKAKSPTRAGNSISKVYQTHTIKKNASQKATPVDEPPEWVRSRILKKTDKATVPTSKKSTTVTTTSKTTTSTAEERRNSTDLITSGYGCGPTDENGAPLFGLRALRSGNKTASKVQGTVVSSQYYSENGNEPIGQISVTKYSSDPTDFEPSVETKEKRGISSVTTTQKFGYKDSPKFGSLGKKQICDSEETSSKTSTFTRKNSVKAISQKFIDNTVESLKSERAYPKAGLILRSSSFKDEEDQGFETGATSSVTKTSSSYKTSSSTGCDSFLTNKSQVTSVQDVINRMRSDDLVLEGESADDVEAKGLLNKFLGSQVILAGLEGSLQNKPTTTVKKSTQVTRTVTESGKPVTTTLKFSNPITDQELETVWDQTTLRFLLDQSTDYEERKKIRARLRQIMAEQEACTDLVTKASQEQSSGTIEGESLLLPLLQGLLDAPEPDQTPDSGTESAGEDQRSGLIAEVQNALDKLSASLRSDATDVTAERRASLLQLVTKLQAGLAGSSKSFERRSSSAAPSRFSRRRHRPSRHTVGVSSEELADARKLMEVISHEITPSHSNSAIALQKQNSESAVSGGEEHSKMLKSHVKNSTAKPFNSSFSRSTSNASSVPTPEVLEGTFVFDPKPLEGSILNQPVEVDLPLKKENQPDLILQSNPVYQEVPKPQSFEDKSNRFNSKKLRMKRANTIDIPKPLNFYEDDDTDDDFNDQKRRDYLALRGPIRVNTPDSKNWTPPLLQPKTDNDKKFMAFISKHNEKNNQGTVWNSPNNKASVWGSKFGNIKTNFEKAAPLTDQSNGGGVRNFWKSADDSVRFGNGPKRNSGPKISKESAHNLQKMFEEKKRQSFEDNNWANDGIVTGSLKVANAYEQPKPMPHKFVPQPLPVNKFSHAPSSAFQPLPQKKLPDAVPLVKTELAPPKTPTSREEAPLFLYSPKPYHKDSSISPTSPMGNSKPWANISGGEKRVLNLAASKFEQPLQNVPVKPSVTPRRLSKEQIFLPSTLPAQSNISTPPYLGKSIDGKNGSSVRKLSGQYDNLGFNTQNVCTENRFQPKFTVPQNYSIKYDQPVKPETPKIDNSTPKFTVPQNYSVTYDKPKVNPELAKHQKFSQSFDQPDPKLDENYLAYKTRHASPTYQAQTQVKTTIFAVPQEPNTKIASKTIVKVSEIPKYETQVSNESIHEHNAVSSRVMTGPVAQTADTVRQKSPMTRGEHDFEAALGLRNALSKIGNVGSKSPSPNPVTTAANNKNLKINMSNNVAYGKPKELLEVTDLGESIVTKKSESRKVTTEGPVTTTQVSSRMTTQQITKKPISPFAKFRQLDKQNSLNTPPSTPKTPGGGSFFKFTDPALSQSASTIKERLLHWCRMKTKEYENIQLDNFSTSWADGLAFCALIHHFQPTAFDYHELTPKNRRHNFTLAFQVADEKADIAPLLDVDDMVATRKPDWKCVFTYVQSIYRRYKDED